ncbi:MAG: outer membrane protein assembly factor BamD, partial [Candidatus Zixiibacteriota bacterium]
EYLLTARTRLAKKYYKSGIVYVRIRRYGPAKTYFQKVIDDYTDTEYATKASYQLAEIDYANRDFGEALRRYDNFLAVFPDHELSREAARKAEEAAFKWAEAAFRNGDYDQARQRFEMFLNDYSASKRRDKADRYLEEIAAMSPSEPVTDSTGSENEG